MHTLDFLSLVLFGELKVELNVSFSRACAMNHSGLCNKATVVGVGSELYLFPESPQPTHAARVASVEGS